MEDNRLRNFGMLTGDSNIWTQLLLLLAYGCRKADIPFEHIWIKSFEEGLHGSYPSNS